MNTNKLALEALKPFAALLQSHNNYGVDATPLFAVNEAMITRGDLRRVVAAIAALEAVQVEPTPESASLRCRKCGDSYKIQFTHAIAQEPVADRVVDRAWTQFCAAIGDSPKAPYPGMIKAFENYYAQSFADKDWRNEASVWAAAWKAALYATSQQSAPEIDRLRASNAELLTELQAIANANPKNWDAPLNDTASFQAWAQSRARAAIAKAEQS